ncbi:MAG: MFS transporter [Alphaproteobacteria bacterium]
MNGTAAEMRGDPTRRNVFLLSLCLGFSMTGAVVVMTVSALTGQMLAEDKALATLPFALQWIASMAATMPASLFMRRFGRRAGFTLGQSFGLLAALGCTVAVMAGSFWAFALTNACFGIHNAFWQYYRFAAADTAPENFRSKAISLTLAGGVVAALLGPELSKLSVDLLAPATFAGSYLIIGLLCLVTTSILQFLRIPRPTAVERADSGRPLRQIAAQPVFIVAVLSATLGYATMALIMTATPLAMVACGFSFSQTASVIQWHVLAMYVPSFFTGALIRRFGVHRIVATGTLLLAGCAAVGLSGVALEQFFGALVLLGLGWNFMFIGGTSLLTGAHTQAERAKVQGFNDFLVFSSVSLASAASGLLQNRFGWEALNYGILAPALAVLAAVLWLRIGGRGPKPA